jgi:transposase-like protein
MPKPSPRRTRCRAMALARQSGVPVRLIAAHYGVSRQAVYRASLRRGVARPIDPTERPPSPTYAIAQCDLQTGQTERIG